MARKKPATKPAAKPKACPYRSKVCGFPCTLNQGHELDPSYDMSADVGHLLDADHDTRERAIVQALRRAEMMRDAAIQEKNAMQERLAAIRVALNAVIHEVSKGEPARMREAWEEDRYKRAVSAAEKAGGSVPSRAQWFEAGPGVQPPITGSTVAREAFTERPR